MAENGQANLTGSLKQWNHFGQPILSKLCSTVYAEQDIDWLWSPCDSCAMLVGEQNQTHTRTNVNPS
ncbi:hypothetical protein T265_07043 [Opisthorchis viverrini]|uniref:Uncharacterized protein n=1 Tax=Opisthorchis viverrini TaxID=6198 RepID=A0A074ZEC8_OPIVI|nr:hypothetical protein T265_07043 [Opisthorchis viverrini]KER25528.1 hypothetical protein T265_07043 [Opisthorchis viverrini]